MLSTSQLVKETLLMGTLNIGLPTTDVGTDAILIYSLFGGFPSHPNCTYESHPCYQTNCTIINAYAFESEWFATCLAGIPEEELEYESHPTWATMLLVPFLLNYFASWFTWYRIDKRKKITWLACLFNVYPQLRAANVIRELWRDPKKGVVKKRKFQQEFSEAEVYLESVFATFVMTYMLASLDSGTDSNIRAGHHLGEGNNLFWITYLTSFFSAGLGMAKSFKIGPCRILPDIGLLGQSCKIGNVPILEAKNIFVMFLILW